VSEATRSVAKSNDYDVRRDCGGRSTSPATRAALTMTAATERIERFIETM